MSQKNPPRPTPNHSYQVEVRLKAEFTDADGLSALCLLQGLGLNTARELRTSHLYEIRGPLTAAQVQQVARELLCDAVTQEFKLLAPAAPMSNGMNHWRVEVWLKPSVTDPVGETVRSALLEMGYPSPETVRAGTAYHIVGKCPKGQLEKIVPRCLANPVIHRFSITESHP
jgi:phosphoribosylformylglycinamidine (FGAM) synthase PurS component